MATSKADRPNWLRQREIGETNGTKIRISNHMMQRLQHEATLEGHGGCVNCLEWSQGGNLLASGSDDHNVIVWDAFRRTTKNVIESGHRGTIFSVKFVPDNTDSLVATCASDCSVKLIEISSGKNMLTCSLCHDDRVKRLATHPSQPNLLWSAGEDGYILQFDLRQPHVCNDSRPNNLLIDLKTGPHVTMAKCIATNPMRDEMLAVGSNDIYNRLYDRRYLIKESGRNRCTTYFVPGHLVNSNNRSNHLQSFGTTYLAFSPDGSELLASVHAEQVYLFNVHEPWERYKSFETSLKPLLLDKQPATSVTSSKMLRHRPYLQWYDLKNARNPRPLPEQYRSFYEEAEEKTFDELKLAKEVFDELNSLILKYENCPDLYRLRAEALLNRAWRGDEYQALRDCSSALALKPFDTRTLSRLAVAVCRLGYKDAAIGLLEILELMSKEICRDNYLTCAMNLLKTFKKQTDNHGRSRFGNDQFQEFMFDAGQHNLTSLTSPELLMELMSGTQLSLGDLKFLSHNDHKELNLSSSAFDYSKRFCGHCNMNTDIKEANFFGSEGEFIVGGSDDGAFYIWDKATTNIVKAVSADNQILNCVQPHPSICLLATSGIDTSVKLWSTLGNSCRDIDSIETRCTQNQQYISIDPLEAMLMMLYPDR